MATFFTTGNPMLERGDRIELLAPAKNAEFGMEAIAHGADAVYIGGPAFGARAHAGNPVADIEKLVAYAHRFNARVLVALNTLFRDEELEAAQRLAWRIHEAGADALIVQGMGLLELDLPPIALHANTQCDIRTPDKARFLEATGFSQLVLARELSIEQIRAIAEHTAAVLEFFVHGSLCVGYSGLCNLSHARTGRSANRGDCSQPCRLPYTLRDGNGRIVAETRHLLSLKDNDQSGNLAALIDAGIRSIKIEGRLKDLSYVKNVTAHYRLLLDALLEKRPGLRRGSSGRSEFFFTPQPGKSFNRGATDYFLNGRRRDIGAFDSPKFIGEKIGEIVTIARDSFEIRTRIPLHNGDGVAYFSPDNELIGMRINVVETRPSGQRLFPTSTDRKLPAGLHPGTTIYRNHDQGFERQLEKKSADRRVPVDMRFEEAADGFALHLRDDEGVGATANIAQPKERAQNAERALASLRENLDKLGNTLYRAENIELAVGNPWFVPASALNALRRAAVTALDAARLAAYERPTRARPAAPLLRYPEDALGYLGNVLNRKARTFYEKHGVTVIEQAFEAGLDKGEVSLMVTKHCLRYSFNLCPKQVKGTRPDPMVLSNGRENLTLRFDCKLCEMHVIGKQAKGAKDRSVPLEQPD